MPRTDEVRQKLIVHGGLPRKQIIARLARLVNSHGGIIAFADKHKLRAEYVRQILKWTTPAPVWMLAEVGISRRRETRIVYEEV